MKLSNVFNKVILGTASIAMLASCQKSETNLTESKEQEGLKSSTQSTEKWEIDESKAVKPNFHKHYSADLSEKEAQALWKKDFEKYLKESSEETGTGSSRTCDYFKYVISTYTGTGTNEGTDGKVVAHQQFYVNGNFQNQTVTLNNSGNDREGGWDFYYITKNIVLSDVRLKRIQIALKGTDGWYLKKWNVAIYGSQQDCSAFGESKSINNSFNTWLDSPYSSEWDMETIYVNSTDRVYFF